MTPEERVSAMPLHWLPPPHQGTPDMPAQYREIVKVVREAVAAEREACAKIAESIETEYPQVWEGCDVPDSIREGIAAAIRARAGHK